MIMEQYQTQYGEHAIKFRVKRRARKTLEIAVEPDASVVVSAPYDALPEAINSKVRKRAAWIRRQQKVFSKYLPRTPDRRFISGETHFYLGRQYRLRVVPHEQEAVGLSNGFLIVQSRKPKQAEVTRNLVEQWYKQQARLKFEERLAACLRSFSDPESFRPKGLVIRHLRQRWGSMSPSARLLLNRRLIEAPVDTIDYVIVHELCHISERHHGPEFYRLLDQVMPDWAERKERLEQQMA